MAPDADPMEIFLDIQRGLPRQGPGSDESTARALSLCRELPADPAVLDIGCGPGMQTMVLARALGGHITAVDLHQEYLDQLAARVRTAGVADRIEIRNGDMHDLPFPPQAFDLVWSEGAAYIMGVREALAAWKPLLRAGGYIALTELVWLRDAPPRGVTEFFAEAYPAMTDVAGVLNAIRATGYETVGEFTLPDRDWWEHYYTPLEGKLPPLREKYAQDGPATDLVEATAREIETRRRFGTSYGYQFFVARKPR
ncbi:MAG: SAM-dependent methyltransferase [Phycisphaeraceae bacterium]|nr:SAM-dependent methyltransferase [Phycisphaeraceae bacterium]